MNSEEHRGAAAKSRTLRVRSALEAFFIASVLLLTATGGRVTAPGLEISETRIADKGGRIVLANDDGIPVAPNSYEDIGLGSGAKELVRFEAPTRMQIDRLRFIADGRPGSIEIHFWRDIDSSKTNYIPFEGFEFDATPSVTADVTGSELGRWTEVELPASGRPLVLERGMRLFVAARVSPDSTRFSCDAELAAAPTSFVEVSPSGGKINSPPVIFEPSGDFMVRLEGMPVADDPGLRFEDVTERVSLQHATASAFAWADVDGDGWQDLLMGGGRLFMNLRGRAFREVPLASGLEPDSRSFGLFADIDSDGDLDLFSAAKGRGDPDLILINDGRGNFRVVPEGLGAESAFGCAGSWLDADADGRIDLYVANGTVRGDTGSADADVYYRNLGGGRFERFPGPDGPGPYGAFTSSATSGDLFGDSRPEIFAGTYRLEPDTLLSFDGGKPVDISLTAKVSGGPTPSGTDGFGHAIGANFADLDGDGDLDIVVANLIHPDWRGLTASNESWFFENLGDGTFSRIALRELGVAFEETVSDPAIADFDNDGLLDLFHHSWYHTANIYAFRSGSFEDRTASSGIVASQATASAAADFDRDGRIDLIVADKEAGLKLYRNISPRRNWIGFRLEGTHCSRDAIGAVGRLRTGGRVLTGSVTSGRGGGGQDSLELHFGLGAEGREQTLEISWVCGRKQIAGPFRPGRTYKVRESD